MTATSALPASARTAIARRKPSAPAKAYTAASLLAGLVLDYGCGRGADVAYYKSLGLDACGYDPFHPGHLPAEALADGLWDAVTCTYVLNVLESPQERLEVLRAIRRLLVAGGRICIAVRSTDDVAPLYRTGTREGDGVRTRTGTFQHGFYWMELWDLLEEAGFITLRHINTSKIHMLTAVSPDASAKTRGTT